jgi:2-polyprenyl-6-methoxyphenol hydroxylase-like FAD-dependent oxidoreductase
MMLGVILARAGRRIVVLEKHDDFFRDFRGDTIHPSTIAALGELGLRERFLRLPLNRVRTLDLVINRNRFTPIDFGTLRRPNNFLVFAPQWDFLNFLADVGKELPGFELRMGTAAEDVIVEGGVVRGVRTAGGAEIRATLTVGADGRSSTVRGAAGLTPTEFGVPIDVLWFHLPKPENPPVSTLAYLDQHSMVLTIERGDHYQGGLVIPKGGYDQLRERGLAALRETIVDTAPVLAPVVGALQDWDQVKLLTVQVNRLPTWYRTGLLCIGDAAHAMSPAGGVGVNYAIQDAIAAANLIAGPLAGGAVPVDLLASVQRRREPPVVRMQRVQLAVHRRIGRPGGGAVLPDPIPGWLRFALRTVMPVVRRVTARVVGLGFRPEHVAQSLR